MQKSYYWLLGLLCAAIIAVGLNDLSSVGTKLAIRDKYCKEHREHCQTGEFLLTVDCKTSYDECSRDIQSAVLGRTGVWIGMAFLVGFVGLGVGWYIESCHCKKAA